MKTLIKKKPHQVLLDDQDSRDLARLVDIERRARRDMTVGGGTLLRELAMPAVREKLAAHDRAAA